MPIISNPQVRRIAVPVGSAKVILVLRAYTTDEYARFMGNRFGFKKKGRLDDKSMDARIKFVDTLLADIEALDSEGRPDHVVYYIAGREEKLSSQVENWKDYVNPSWKISDALELEGESAEIEDGVIKN